MDTGVIELVVQTGALGLTALLLIGLWRYGGGLVTRLMDNLDKQAEMNHQAVLIQAEVAASIEQLSKQLYSSDQHSEEAADERAEKSQAGQAEVVKMQETMCDVLTGLSRKIQAHETRAQRRHEQLIEQAAERHGELVAVLRVLNGQASQR